MPVPGFPGAHIAPNGGPFLFEGNDAGGKSMREMEQKAKEDPAWADALRQQMAGTAQPAQPSVTPSATPKTPGELALYQREQAAKARAMGIGGSTVEDPRATGEGSEYADPSGKKYKMINGVWKRIQ